VISVDERGRRGCNRVVGRPGCGVRAGEAAADLAKAGFDRQCNHVTAADGGVRRRTERGAGGEPVDATGSEGGVEGVVIAGYEDRFIRFFDANSGTLPPSLDMPAS